MGCTGSRGCRESSSCGNLSCRDPLSTQPLTAVGQWSRPAGSEHTAKPTRAFPGPGKRERGQKHQAWRKDLRGMAEIARDFAV